MMDEKSISPETQERSISTTLHLPNGTSLRRSSSSRPSSTTSPEGNLHHYNFHTTILTIIKDNKGYGMKVSGDNPVYVQSVKEGGAAEKAGLHSGDKIIKVNGTDVTHSTHTEVVELIKSCIEVELTVQQRIMQNTRPPVLSQISTNCNVNNRCSSPVPTTASNSSSSTNTSSSVQRPLHHHHSAPARDRITAPQPVDHEKLRQLECQRVQTFRLMLEKEQRYVEALRSELAKCSDTSNEQQISRNLMGAERRVRTLQEQLQSIISNNNYNTLPTESSNGLSDVQLFATPPTPPPLSTLPSRIPTQSPSDASVFTNSLYNTESPPPLPSRNRNLTSPVLGTSPNCASPPPLPPRQYLHSPISNVDGNQDSTHNTTAIDCSAPDSPLPVHHQRTKSNPDKINNSNMSTPVNENSSKRLIASESLCDLSSVKRSKGGVSWDVESPLTYTPPGTPPPPYHKNAPSSVSSSPVPQSPSDELDDVSNIEETPPRSSLLNDSSSPNVSVQATIISMEDDDMSDQDISQLEDHGPFKSVSKLWEHNAHLAVFLNYVISNSEPSSILFYLVTDLYKEGNGKDMRKWAYEIHSSFLGPGAPLRLNNVDENIAREIDDVLLNEADKEEILRKVFWKARLKAKEELNDQLTDFQQKRTAGLGTLFGPPDIVLDECIHDKNKEMKIVEQYLVPKMEPLIEEIEREIVDDRKYTTAAAFGTILSKIFGIRGQHFNSLLERCPTFVSKEKSLKARFIGRSRKVNVRGHHFIAHQYFTVTYCNHCQLIIRGIGPQGYQCTNCLLNIHRPCVKILEENCPGPLIKKERANDRISKLMDKIRPERKPSSLNFAQIERIRRQTAEGREDGSLTDNESGDKTSAGGKNNNKTNNNTNAFTDSTKETDDKHTSKQFLDSESNFLRDISPAPNLSQRCKSSGTSINRSESYKERIHQKRQIRERRKTSDPNLSKTNADVEIDANSQFPYPSTNSGSSSNSNLSSRSLESPNNSLETVGSNNKGSCENTSVTVPSSYCSSSPHFNTCSVSRTSAWDSDTEAEPDPPDWTKSVPPDVITNFASEEKKRQEVINELFHTERTHVRALKILDQLFYQPMKENQILPPDQLQLLFPNLEEMLEIHSQFNTNMKLKKKESTIVGDVGDILLKMFDGVEGEIFERAAATFCSRQQIALEGFKERRRKDLNLQKFLNDAECHPVCRRLQLKDIIPASMLRLTKYPLLFENLAKYSKDNPKEERCVQRALERSKEILNRVNEAVKESEDQHRLAEIQKKLDKSPFVAEIQKKSEIQKKLDKPPFDKVDHLVTNEVKNLDLTKHKLIHEGSLNWRIANKQKLIDLHVLLLQDVIILLQKQDEKYVLKFNMNSGTNVSPVIQVSTVLVRDNAVDKKGLYLVDTSHHGTQIYDLVATSVSEKQLWFKRIKDAADAYKAKEEKQRNNKSLDSSSVSSHDLENCGNGSESVNQLTKPKEQENSTTNENTSIHSNTQNIQDELPNAVSTNETAAKKLGGGNVGLSSPNLHKKRIPTTEPPRLTTEVPLIEPSQVLISQRAVLTAEPVLTPFERLRRNDETIREALIEKQKLVADILHVPKEELRTTTDSAVVHSVYDKEASDLMVAAVNQIDQLTGILNECLRVTEEDSIAASCEVNSGTAVKGQIGASSGTVRTFPTIPVLKVQSITNSLSAHLSQLLTLITERDEERERLRQELQRSREQLHAMHEAQQRFQLLHDHVAETQPENSANEVLTQESDSNINSENRDKK